MLFKNILSSVVAAIPMSERFSLRDKFLCSKRTNEAEEQTIFSKLQYSIPIKIIDPQFALRYCNIKNRPHGSANSTIKS